MAKKDLRLLEPGEDKDGDIIDFCEDIIETKNLNVDLRFVYISNPKQKQLIKITKVPDTYAIAMKKEILVQINETYFDMITEEEIKKILIEQEIDKIEIDGEKGTIKIAKHSVSTNFGIVNKYTFENVQKAIETENHLEEQIKERKQE